MSLVRQATPKDFPCILNLYDAGLRELGETNQKETFLLKKIANSYHAAPCFLLVINDRICGMAGLTVVTSSHDGVASITDYMFFIKPENRSLRNLGALVKAAKRFAKEHDMPIKFDFIVNDDEKLKRRLLTMHGFRICYVSGIYNEIKDKSDE